MTGDYLKQLQLAKQLEQKTKEAGKVRKETEDRTVEAQKAIASAKSLEASTVEAEKLLIESGQAAAQRDFKNALALATKSIEASNRAKKDKVSSIIDSAQSLLKLFQDKDIPGNVSASIKKAQSLLDEGVLDEAYTKAKALWDEVERFVNHKMGEYFGGAQTLLLVGEKVGVPVESERHMLSQARENMEAGKYEDSLQKIRECHDLLGGALRDLFGARADAVRELGEFSSELKKESTKANELMAKAEGLLKTGDFEGTFATLPLAEAEARASVSRTLLVNSDSLKNRAGTLKSYGVDEPELLEDIAHGRELARGEKVKEAMEAWRENQAWMQRLETEQFLQLIAKLRSRILLASKVKSDTSKVMAKLELARQSMGQGEFEKAAALVKESEGVLEQQLGGYREVEDELAKTKTLLLVAASLQAEVDRAKALLDQSRQSAMNRDFPGAVATLRRAQAEAHDTIQSGLGQDIIKAEMKVTTALKLGADITKESAALEEAVAKVRAMQYTGLRQEIGDCILEVEKKIAEQAASDVKEAETLFAGYAGPVPLSAYKPRLLQAQEALRTGHGERAYEVAKNLIEAIRREEKSALDKRLAEAKHLLSIAKDLGSGSSTLNEKLARAEDLRIEGKVPEALKLAEEVAEYSRSILKDELSRRAAQLIRQVAAARKNGVEVLQPERLAEEAGRSLKRGDLEGAHAQIKEGETTLEKQVLDHTQIYDRIADMGSLLKEAEAQGLETGAPAEMLASAKRLFETGHYEEARPAAARAFVETEKLVAPFVAPRRIGATKDLLAVAKRMGFESALAEKKIEQAQANLDKKQYTDTMAAIREAERTVNGLLRKGAEAEIQEIKANLAKVRETGTDVSAVQQILAKAESLLVERRVYDSLRALELAKNELDQAFLVSERTHDALEKAQSTLAEAQEFGLNVAQAAELLRQARNYYKMGRQGISHELAKKAGDQTAQSVADLVRDNLRKLEMNYRHQELDGPNLEAAMRMKGEIESRLGQRRFKEAFALTRTFEDELKKVQEQKRLATRSLEELTTAFGSAKKEGLVVPSVESLLTQAKAKLAEGAFYESFALAVKCGDELRSQNDQYGRRKAELKELELMLKDLEGEPVTDVLEMAERARNALSSLDFEMANLTIRRGKTAASEALANARVRYAGEFEDLWAAMEELGIDGSGMPTSVRAVAERKASSRPVELRTLRDATRHMSKMVLERVQTKQIEIEREVTKAKSTGADVSASEEFLNKSKEALRSNDARTAWLAMSNAQKHIGVAEEEQRDFVDLRTKVEAKIENARRNGLELTETIALYRLAEELKTKDHRLALGKIIEASDAADKAALDFLPDIQVDIDFLEDLKQGKACKARLRFANEGKAMARDVCVRMQGDLEVSAPICLPKLRGGEKVAVEIEVLPKAKGEVKGVLMLECKPVLSNDTVGFETEFDVRVD